jgi:hypothetical protein
MRPYDGPVVPGCGNPRCEQSQKRATPENPKDKNIALKSGPAELRPWPTYVFCHICQTVSTYELIIPGFFKRLSGRELTFELKSLGQIDGVPDHSRDGLEREIRIAERRGWSDT